MQMQSRSGIIGGGLVAAPIIAFLAFDFIMGLAGRGHEWRRYYRSGPSIFSPSKTGFEIGSKKFYARQGQTLVVTATVTPKAGGIRFWFHERSDLNMLTDLPTYWRYEARTAGTWTHKVPIPKNGFYVLDIDATYDRQIDASVDALWNLE